MNRWLAALSLCTALALAGPSPALAGADPPSSGPDIETLTRDGIDRLMRALEAFIDLIPQYEMPEINEQGDIIIRRKRKPEEIDPDIDETRT